MLKKVIIKIVSGGQTGADRGGLDAAIELGVSHGGWCPKGRLAEDGVIPEKYNLLELESIEYIERTKKNVVDSTATVVFSYGGPEGGSFKTVEFAQLYSKPYLVLDMNFDYKKNMALFVEWVKKLPYEKIILNVAGSRGSERPSLQNEVCRIIKEVVGKFILL